MPRTRAQRWRETVNEGGWADLPGELMAKVLELLWAAGPTEPPWVLSTDFGGLKRPACQSTAIVRLVCAGWQAVHDATTTRLVLSMQTTDQAMGMLARRFPTVASLEMKYGDGFAALTDQGMRAVSRMPALTFLDLTWCCNVTDEGVRAVVSSCTALKTLNLYFCIQVTDEGVRAVVSSCTALRSLSLRCSGKVTDEGVRALSSLPALTSLDLRYCYEVTDEGVRALSSLPALTALDVRFCGKVTAAGVQALRSATAAPSLHIQSRW
jgi:hypothetical protein